MQKILYIISKPFIVRQLMGKHIKWLVNQGFEITICTSPGNDIDWIIDQGASVKEINFERTPNLFRDIISLINLINFLSNKKFDVIHYSTPKTSLLASIATLFANKETKKIYTLRGRAYENFSGFKRKIYEWIEKFTCKRSDYVIFVSNELKNIFINQNYTNENNSIIFGQGSSNGFDSVRFSKIDKHEKNELRLNFNLKPNHKVVGFVGRFCLDKGIIDFIKVAKKAVSKGLVDKFIIIGPDEIGIDNLLEEYGLTRHFLVKKWSQNVQEFIQIMDIMFFPSHREGFGNVCVESALCGVPVVAYNVMGCRESVKNDITGFLVPLNDTESAYKKISYLLMNSDKYNEMSIKSREWAKDRFSQNIIWNGIKDFYKKLDE